MELINTSTMIVRQMNSNDELEFQSLLRSVYGETYSYKNLYIRNGYSKLINSKNVTCFGQFNSGGSLIGHTGFFFNSRENYAISGLSMRIKNSIKVSKDDELKSWKAILRWVSKKVAYLHQNTTTYHLLAQMYAYNILEARTTGIIIDYAIGERLSNFKTPNHPMQALTQTTFLHPETRKIVYISENDWFDWISLCFKGLNRIPQKVIGKIIPFTIDKIETISEISLERRRVKFFVKGNIEKSNLRTDLIHFPCYEGHSFEPLLVAGYIPVGVMPNVTKYDEIVFQHLPISKRPYAIKTIKQAKLFSKRSQVIVKKWIELCEETM